MRFAFCLFRYFPFGGLQRNFLQMAREALRRGHQVDVYVGSWEGSVLQGLNIIQVPSKGFTNHGWCSSFVNQLKQQIHQKSYHAVVGFNRMPGLDVYEMADICYEYDIRTRHTALYRLLPRYKIYSSFERSICQKEAQTHILLLTSKEKEHLIHYYQTPLHRLHVLPPGVERPHLTKKAKEDTRQQIRTEHALMNDHLLLLFIAANFKLKGLTRVISSIATLPPVMRSRTRLWVIGPGNPSDYYKQINQCHLSQNIQFLGSRSDVSSLLCAADLLIHPAHREAGGLVLLEALTTGVPVLTTDVCGFAPHIAQAKAGCILSSPFNQEEMNQTLQLMLIPEALNTWGLNGFIYSQKTDLYHRATRAVDLIEHVARQKIISKT